MLMVNQLPTTIFFKHLWQLDCNVKVHYNNNNYNPVIFIKLPTIIVIVQAVSINNLPSTYSTPKVAEAFFQWFIAINLDVC